MSKRKTLRSCGAVVLVAAWACCALGARAGERLEVRGARSIHRDRAVAILTSNGWSPSERSKGIDRLEEAYFRDGFLLARVGVSYRATDSTWVVVVDEGERSRVGRSRIGGMLSRDPHETLDALGLVEDAPYRPRELSARIHDLLESYDEDGRPFAQVWMDSLGFDPDRNRVNVSLFVIEGERRVIQNVSVEGLKKTRPELAVRISGLRTGVPYRARLLRDAYLRLSASGVFSDVSQPSIRLSPDGRGVDAVLVVGESERAHSFTSAVGYATREGTEDRQISGLAQLQLNNIGGTLRNFGVFWSNDGRGRIETRIDYRDQFFIGRRTALGVTLEQVGLDTVYTWQSAGVDFERPVGRVAGSLIGVSLALHGDRNVFSVGALTRSWRVRTSLGASLLRRSAGASLRVTGRFTLARKRRIPRAGAVNSLNQYITAVETDATVRLRPVLHVRSALAYRGLESDESLVPLSELFYVGGARTLRGYKENQFPGRRVATSRTELLVGRNRSENLYIFGDAGYIVQESLGPDGAVRRDELVRTGWGFGLRTQSRLGNVDLSFGVGRKLSLQQTKVHVILEQSF